MARSQWSLRRRLKCEMILIIISAVLINNVILYDFGYLSFWVFHKTFLSSGNGSSGYLFDTGS